MSIRHLQLYSTIGCIMVATGFVVVMKLSLSNTTTNLKAKPKLSMLNPQKSQIKMVQFSYRGFRIIAAAEKRHFKNKKLLLNIQKTIRLLTRQLLPITPFFVVYYSAYSGQQLSILEITRLDTINEKNSWLEEKYSDGYMIEPDVMYPVK
eukprot:92201_1